MRKLIGLCWHNQSIYFDEKPSTGDAAPGVAQGQSSRLNNRKDGGSIPSPTAADPTNQAPKCPDGGVCIRKSLCDPDNGDCFKRQRWMIHRDCICADPENCTEPVPGCRAVSRKNRKTRA